MPLTITILDVPATLPIFSPALGFYDVTNFCSGVTITTGAHGSESLSLDLNLTEGEVDALFARNGHPQVIAQEDGAMVFRGRIEDVARKSTGSSIVAYGFARKFSDRTFTNLYTDSQYSEWRQTLPTDVIFRTNYEYIMDSQNQLYIGLKAQQTYGYNIDNGSFYYKAPSYLSGQGPIKRLTYSYEYRLPANWQIYVNTYDDSFGSVQNCANTLATTGSVQTGSVTLNLPYPNSTVEIGIYTSNPANYLMSFDDGYYYIRLTDVTVMGVTIAGVTATEIMKDLIAFVGAPVSSRTSAVEDTFFTLHNERHEDETPAQIMDRLAALGNTYGKKLEWGVDNDGLAYLQTIGSASREWLAKSGNWSVERTTEGYYNTVYGVYKDNTGRVIRTAEKTNQDALDYSGVARRIGVQLQGSNGGIAAQQRDIVLADKSTYPLKAQVTVNRIFTPEGMEWPLGHVKAGDYITVLTGRITSSENETVRRFRIAHTSYQPESESLTLEPEEPFGSLEFVLARNAIRP